MDLFFIILGSLFLSIISPEQFLTSNIFFAFFGF